MILLEYRVSRSRSAIACYATESRSKPIENSTRNDGYFLEGSGERERKSEAYQKRIFSQTPMSKNDVSYVAKRSLSSRVSKKLDFLGSTSTGRRGWSLPIRRILSRCLRQLKLFIKRHRSKVKKARGERGGERGQREAMERRDPIKI